MFRNTKYIDSNILQVVTRERNYYIHKQKLAQTSTHGSLSRKENMMFMINHQKMQANRFYTKQSKQMDKAKQIQKQNDKILNRIVEINNRDIKQSRSQGVLNNSRVNSASSNKSLNYSYRKQEAVRIAQANQQFMERLIQTPSAVGNKKSLSKDYSKQIRHQEIKNRISKRSYQNQSRMNSLISNLSMTREFSMTQQRLSKPSLKQNFKPQAQNSKKNITNFAANLARLRVSPHQQQVQKLKLPKINLKI